MLYSNQAWDIGPDSHPRSPHVKWPSPTHRLGPNNHTHDWKPERMWHALDRVAGIWFAIWTVIFEGKLVRACGNELVFTCLLFMSLFLLVWIQDGEIGCAKSEQLNPSSCVNKQTYNMQMREIVWGSANVCTCYFSKCSRSSSSDLTRRVQPVHIHVKGSRCFGFSNRTALFRGALKHRSAFGSLILWIIWIIFESSAEWHQHYVYQQQHSCWSAWLYFAWLLCQ